MEDKAPSNNNTSGIDRLNQRPSSVSMESKRPAAIVVPSPELSASSLIIEEEKSSNGVKAESCSSIMYDAYLETCPAVALPAVSGRAFLDQNAALFLHMSAADAAKGDDPFKPPPPSPPLSYHRQVTPPELMALETPGQSASQQVTTSDDTCSTR